MNISRKISAIHSGFIVRNALIELLVIGHVQRSLLEQTIQREVRERSRLEEEVHETHQATAVLRRITCSEGCCHLQAFKDG